MYKILFGIPAMTTDSALMDEDGCIRDREVDSDMLVLCDFELLYLPEYNCYEFSFETMLGFEEKDGARKWIQTCFDELTKYMNMHNYDTTKELDLYKVFTEGVDVNTSFESIEEAYAWLKIMLYGFNGQGLFTK